MLDPNLRLVAILMVSSDMRSPQDDKGGARSQSPVWGGLAASSLAWSTGFVVI